MKPTVLEMVKVARSTHLRSI